jgi:hypothetical protein
MQAGEYYVGDLTYVLDTAVWTELHTLIDATEYKYGTCTMGQGKFTLNSGRVVVIYNLPSNGFRRRDYDDLKGRWYYNSSGTFGLTLAEGLEEEYHDKGLKTSPEEEGEDWDATLARLAHIITYSNDFNCSNVVSNQIDGNLMGFDCEVAVIQFGGEVFVDTEENYSDDSEDSDEWHEFNPDGGERICPGF